MRTSPRPLLLKDLSGHPALEVAERLAALVRARTDASPAECRARVCGQDVGALGGLQREVVHPVRARTQLVRTAFPATALI
jgi:hypothetical protein